MKDIYPLTIISDRYNGVYSKGKYTAWRLDYWDLPEEIECDDVTCMNFWDSNIMRVGLGDTPNEAMEDLQVALDKSP